MPSELLLILPPILLGAGAGLLGGIVALVWKPTVHARSAVQHFAAGAVLAAIATGVIPEAERIGELPGVLGGFAAGGLGMIALKWFVLRTERRAAQRGPGKPIGLALAAALDTLMDGALISAGFSTGQKLGTLLAIALAIDLFFLNLSVGAEFRQGRSKGWRGLAVTSGIASLLLVGALGARVLLAGASEATVAIVLAVGSATLIYLIAEELLVETIQAEDSLFSTATLFVGFLVVLALKMIGG